MAYSVGNFSHRMQNCDESEMLTDLVKNPHGDVHIEIEMNSEGGYQFEVWVGLVMVRVVRCIIQKLAKLWYCNSQVV